MRLPVQPVNAGSELPVIVNIRNDLTMTIMLRKDAQHLKLTCRKSGVKDRSDVSHRFNIFYKFFTSYEKSQRAFNTQNSRRMCSYTEIPANTLINGNLTDASTAGCCFILLNAASCDPGRLLIYLFPTISSNRA